MVGVLGHCDGKGWFLGTEHRLVDGVSVYSKRGLSFSGVKFIQLQRII